jgi:hypothetical protein
MADTTKKLKITGAAAESFMKGTKTRKRAPRGVPLRGGSDEAVVVPLIAPPVAPLPLPLPVPAPLPVVQDAGSKAVKVILDPSKKKAKKIVLSPPKAVIKLAPGPSSSGAKKTHKVSRRIRVSVDGLNKRVNRAKTIKKESQKMPIEQLKTDLEAAGLIKKGSTAPEHILRQMYSDFQVLKQRAL